MKPRVLFLHQNAVLGGAELHLVSVAQCFRESSAVILFGQGPLRSRLERAGVRVRIAASAWAQEGVRGGVPRLNARGAAAVLRLAILVAMQARRYQLIYANSPKALTIAWLAGWLSRRPVLWFFHDLLDPAHFSEAAIRQIVAIANRGADRIVACSAASANSLIQHGGRADRTFVVHHGIDPAEFPESPGADHGMPVAAVFGRVTAWKGQHVAIELLARVPDLQLWIAGEAEDAGYAEELRRRAAELGVTDRVRWLGYRSDIPALMQRADMVLHTSVAPEPFGRVIVEAMFAGRPVIAADGGGVPEIVEDGVSGVLVPPGDVTALAAAVSALLNDPDRAHALAEAGRRRARALFTLETMLRETGRHIHEVARP